MTRSFTEGREAENNFIVEAEKHDWTLVRKASMWEDVYSHWDYLFDTPEGRKFVDIKAHKHVYRNGPLLKDWFWIEWVNVRGNDGWIRGKSDYIAFNYFDEWYIYNTNILRTACELLVDFDKKASRATDADYAIYTRKDKEDQTSLVMISDLPKPHLLWTKPE